MPYTVNKTDGSVLVTVPDAALNNTYSVTFVGKNYGNYGAEFNENFLGLMENFSSAAAPTSPIEGQLWWDSSVKSLRVYYAGAWSPIPISNQITGTVNQITVGTIAGSSFNLSLPQNIHADATPTFRSMSLTATTGAPLTVTSNQLVTNLNADRLDNFDGSYYLNYSNFTNTPNLGTISSQNANAVAITGGTITGLSTALPVGSGGTGADNAADARSNLGLTGLATADLPLSIIDGGTAADNAAGARNNLGLGTIATQNVGNVAIVGGTITGLSSFSVISGTPTVPTAAVTIDNTQIASTAFVHDILPRGVILMWSGTVADVDNLTGWALCNGTNGTPDLRNRFIVGVGDQYSVGDRGGSKDAIVVSHSHNGTTLGQSQNHTHTATSVVTETEHSHRLPIDVFGNTDTQSLTGTPNSDEGIAGNVRTEGATTGITVSTTLTVNSADHTHNFTTNSQGSSSVNANLPPYYALCYIMKVTG